MFQTQLKILYLGSNIGTCLDRANALRRLGHQVEHLNLRNLLPKSHLVDHATWKLGGDLFSYWITRVLPSKLTGQYFDLCYIDGGELVTKSVIKVLRRHANKVIVYNIDDPFGSRDGCRFKAYRNSLPFYDLVVVVRQQNVSEAKALGAKNVLRVYMGVDEVLHLPQVLTDQDHETWDTDVLFLGTWMPERGSFLLELIKRGLPLTIRGSSWNKAPEWSLLKQHWMGPAVYGPDYAKAIQCAKVNLGLLSKGNRDLHTTRSLEIPAVGGLLCAERTSEHAEMYLEGVEALFWSDAEECVAKCKFALQDETRRKSIVEAGRRKVKENGHYNETQLKFILSQLCT